MRDDPVAHGQNRCTRESTGFLCVGKALHGVAAQCCVGGDDAPGVVRFARSIRSVAFEGGSNHLNLLLRQVWRDLDEDRHAAAKTLVQHFLSPGDGAQQGIQRVVALQRAQILRVWAGDVDGHVVGIRVDPVQTGQVVLRGLLNRRSGVFSDVQAQQHGGGACCRGLCFLARLVEGRALHVCNERLQTIIVEAQPIDECISLGQAEHAGLGVAALGARRDGAHFHKAEAHGAQTIDAARVLVEPGGQPHAVGKGEPGEFHRIIDPAVAIRPLQWRSLKAGEGMQREVVGCFRVQTKQKGPGQTIRHKRHWIIPEVA